MSSEDDEDIYTPDKDDREIAALGESEEESGDETEDTSIMDTTPPRRAGGKRSKQRPVGSQKEDLTGLDDGNERLYQNRLRSWVERRSNARAKAIVGKASEVEEGKTLQLG